MWLHSFLPTGAFQHDHHHTEKWSTMKLLFGYRQFHLYRLYFFICRLHPTIGEMKNGRSSLKRADWAEWVIIWMTIYFDPWPFTIGSDVNLTQDRPLLLVRPRWTRLKMTSLPMQLKRASLRIRVTTAEGSGLTFSRWKILTGRPVGDKHVTLYGPLASLGSINSPDTFVANICSSPWSKTEKNKVSSLQTG